MKVIEGHLTNEIYNVIIVKKDKGLIPCPVSLLRLSKYKAKFVL